MVGYLEHSEYVDSQNLLSVCSYIATCSYLVSYSIAIIATTKSDH